MAEVLDFEKPEAAPDEPQTAAPDEYGFVRTATAERILLTLNFVRSLPGPQMSMICGVTGVGKTRALLHYLQTYGQSAMYLSVAKGEGNPDPLSTAIKAQFSAGGMPIKDWRNLTERRIECGQLIGPDRILLVDESQNLLQRNKATATKGAGFGWLSAMATEIGFDLVFCGNMTLPTIKADFPDLRDRMRWPVIIKASTRADVVAIARAMSIVEHAAVSLLVGVAQVHGGLRKVEDVVLGARPIFGSAVPTAAELKETVLRMGLDTKGGA